MTRCPLGAAALLLALAAPAQRPAAAFELPAGPLTVPQLVAAAGACLQWQIACDQKEIGDVEPFTLQAPIRTDAAGAAAVLHALLFARELALAADPARDGQFDVLSLRGARAGEVFDRAAVVDVEALLQEPHGKRFVAVAVPLRNSNPTVATAALRPFLMGGPGRPSLDQAWLRLQANARELSFRGPQDLVARLVLLVRAADQPTQPRQTDGQLLLRTVQLEKQLASLKLRLDERAKAGGGK